MLLLTDDASCQRRIELGLGHFGHLIFSVAHASQAIEFLAASPVDALICDLRLLPDDGHRLVRSARARNPAARTLGITDDPIALLSSEPPTQFDRLLLKPVDCAELHRSILAGMASD